VDLRDLRYFAAIAKSGSMTAAAKALHVSQPTLTVAMKNLEEELATQLLVRERNGVRLTVTGEELLDCANDTLDRLHRTVQRIKGLETDDEGTFILGCNESLGAYFLPDFFARFLRSYPKIELLISNETSAMVTTSVIERRTQFGIVVNPHPHPDLVIVELFHDAMDVLIAENAGPPSRPLASFLKGGGGDIHDASFREAQHRLLAGPLIYAGRVTQCQELLDLLAAAGLLSERKLVVGDMELVKSLALAGIGPALLPRRVGTYGQGESLVRLHPKLPHVPDRICLVYRADMHRTKAAARVKDELIRYGKTLDA
jgi:DNA-binding transcriptional LysR family regulator